ncbi:MAG: hypothetical protein AAB388_00690 [Patescibacteria group bacterium]
MLWRTRFKNRCLVPVTGFLLALLWLELLQAVAPYGLITSLFEHANAAEVTVDTAVSTASAEHLFLGSQTVFISDQTGYKFYVDSTGVCAYSKTVNGGTSWGAAVTIDAQTDCYSVAVWYDQWTPGDSGTNIHIVTADPGNDDTWYNRLDTTSDTRLLGTTPVSVVTGSGQGGSLAAGGNMPSITKATNGVLHIAVSDNTDSYVVECTSSCDLAANWSETGTNPMDLQPDHSLLLPLSGGDLILIQRDISADDLRSKIWDDSLGVWSLTWTNIDNNAIENATYDPGFAATVNVSSGDIFLTYIDNATTGTLGGNNDDVKTAKYSGGSWSLTGNVVTNTSRGLTQVALGIDANTDTVYVAYAGQTTAGTANTANVYFASSTAAMSSWGNEQGPVNTSADDIYGLDVNNYNDERLYVTWYGATPDDIFGDTLADVSPATVLSSLNLQTSEVRASTTDFFVGGTFVVKENITSRNVTDITIAETGTVDAANAIDNIRLYYELDTSNPYTCASESFVGTETQFGSTDTNGFSGSNGTTAFSDSVSISPTAAMCVYAVMDILKSAADGSTLEIEISAPETDVLVSGGVVVVPSTTILLSGATNVVSANLTQTHYHWRNDNGDETLATSRTVGSEDTTIGALQKNSPIRVRIGVSNEGSTSSLPTTLRLEYAENTSTCSEQAVWTDVGATDDDWNIYDSTFLANGSDTTDIAVGNGGVSNENSVFLTPNGAVRDTNSETGSLTFGTTNWTEIEYSIIASTTVSEGDSYCFRVTSGGEVLDAYNNYPQATIAADVRVRATSTQVASLDIPTTNAYIGGVFSLTENTSARNVTGITTTETGTIDAATGLANIRIFYDLDTSNPYDCASESYGGTENQFGATSSAFSAANGIASFSDSVLISTTSTMCAYTVLDVAESAQNSETINITINSASSDVTVTGGGTVSPSTELDLNGSTTASGAVVIETGYHWRNDDGDESAVGATSATGGSANTALVDFSKTSPIRLRVQLSNQGSTTSVPRRYGLEYGIKSTTCDAVGVWSDADGGGLSWSMFDSLNLTNGNDTTDIAESAGGIANPPGQTFLSGNAGVRDVESFSATTTLTNSQFVELEYSLTSTEDTPYETTFCFRVTQNGLPLLQYDQYAEITIEPRRDFRIQRGESTVTGTGLTLTAGVDYVAPSSSSSAFVRITNSHHTGAGRNSGGGNQNADDYTAYISNPDNLVTSFTIARDTDSINNTYVAWEIIEYIGPADGDNEMIVRGHGRLSPSATSNFATGTALSNVNTDADVVVFVTGQFHNGGVRTEGFSHQFTSSWSAATNEPVFRRGANGGNVGQVSYAVVEFTGLNWKVQRVEHAYTAVNTVETESITAVNSLSRTFIHTQKRYNSSAVIADFGHEVWLSSIGAVSFRLDANAIVTNSPVSVVWVIENTQSGTGAMTVERSTGNTTGGTEPVIISIPISTPLNATNNASIFFTTTVNQTGDSMPIPIVGGYITSTTSYQFWRSEASGGGALTYRTEIVQWPAADLAMRQNYYRFYVNNNTLTPDDAWPVGTSTNLGENTAITAVDEPLSDGDRIRIRMSVRVDNATLPAGFLTAKLQYGTLTTTCSAVASWSDVGGLASSTIWRGYNANAVADGASLSTDPPGVGDLLISVADVAGRYVEQNPASANEFAVLRTEDVEYDWIIEQNGASQRTNYCFRMVQADGTELDDYFYYPQLRTAGYSPATQNWRWFEDETNETPTNALAAENIAPSDVDKGSILKLRVTVEELKNLTQANAKFRLQYSTSPDFSTTSELVATSSCVDASVWCYADGAGVDNVLITTSVLSDSEACVAGAGNGCGVHNESGTASNGFTHSAGRAIENEFTIQYTNVDLNFGQVYYFRLYDVTNNEPVAANLGESYPSIAVESARLSFTVGGLPTGTSAEGILLDATSTATAIAYSTLLFNSDYETAQRIAINTNATEGYQVLMYARQNLSNIYGDSIPNIFSTNSVPLGWDTACQATSTGCFGYHTSDGTLFGGSARFAPFDSYAAFESTPREIMYSSIPATDTRDVVFRLKVSELQPAGDYETEIVYIAVPIY